MHFLVDIYIAIVHVRKYTKDSYSKFTAFLMSNDCRVTVGTFAHYPHPGAN